tara:strand:- start:8226 stop:9068 length:843 start_codon:yes stop_codon:yes gene_type:complete
MNNIELVEVLTPDGLDLDGLLFRPTKIKNPESAVLMVHGVGWNFYRGLMRKMAERLANRGFATLSINTRGHDWLARGGSGRDFVGAAFETIEESTFDLDGFIEDLEAKGFTRLALIGHSLGAVKVLKYQAEHPRPSVKTVISVSSPDLSSGNLLGKAELNLDYEAAERLMKNGENESLIRGKFASDMDVYFSAKTIVNKYGPEGRGDVRKFISRINLPTLITTGSEEKKISEYGVRLTEIAKSTVLTRTEIEGADHFYKGKEDQLELILYEWLRKHLSTD